MSGVVVATCMQPIIPVFTAMLAVALKLEAGSLQKFAGIGIAVGGSLCMVNFDLGIYKFIVQLYHSLSKSMHYIHDSRMSRMMRKIKFPLDSLLIPFSLNKSSIHEDVHVKDAACLPGLITLSPDKAPGNLVCSLREIQKLMLLMTSCN